MTPRRFVVMLLVALSCAVTLVWLHCQHIHLCYRIDELRQGNDRLAAECVALDARVSHLRQPYLLAQRVQSMQLNLVSQCEELPATEPVQLVDAGGVSRGR